MSGSSNKKKLKKVKKTSQKAQDKLVDLATAGAKKKRILKQVDEVQSLDKKKRKLKKLSKAKEKVAVKDRAPKGKTKVKPNTVKKKSKKSLVQQKKQPAVAKNNTLRQKKTTSKQTVENKKDIKEPVIASKESKDDSQGLSTNFKVRDTFSKFPSLTSADQVNRYIKGEKRTTVLNKAKARIKAIVRQSNKS